MNSLQTQPISNANLAQTLTQSGQYLTFMLAQEIYAVSILNIKEIIDFGHLTEVPMMPEFVRGVINLRGRVVPVIDLLARFGKGATPIAKRTCIVIVETETSEQTLKSQDLGIIVDAVNEVVNIESNDIEPPPSFGTGIRPDFIAGMIKRNNRFNIILNVKRVLSVEEMTAMSKSTTEHSLSNPTSMHS